MRTGTCAFPALLRVAEDHVAEAVLGCRNKCMHCDCGWDVRCAWAKKSKSPCSCYGISSRQAWDNKSSVPFFGGFLFASPRESPSTSVGELYLKGAGVIAPHLSPHVNCRVTTRQQTPFLYAFAVSLTFSISNSFNLNPSVTSAQFHQTSVHSGAEYHSGT